MIIFGIVYQYKKVGILFRASNALEKKKSKNMLVYQSQIKKFEI